MHIEFCGEVGRIPQYVTQFSEDSFLDFLYSKGISIKLLPFVRDLPRLSCESEDAVVDGVVESCVVVGVDCGVVCGKLVVVEVNGGSSLGWGVLVKVIVEEGGIGIWDGVRDKVVDGAAVWGVEVGVSVTVIDVGEEFSVFGTVQPVEIATLGTHGVVPCGV